MFSVIDSGKQIGPFVGVSAEKILDFGSHGKFRVILYGAYNAFGLIGPESNGIAVLDEVKRDVITDEIEKISSGYFGPGSNQIETFKRILKMNFEEFASLVNNTQRLRREI